MNDEKEPLGVSGFLPPVATATLVRAAAETRHLGPDQEFRRAKIVDSAIRKVQSEYPRYFRSPDDSYGQRLGQGYR